jgi:mannose-6-phosphate isomerase-like protein (cupin superfamily)
MELRERNIEISDGEFLIIPKGVEHRPIAEKEVWVMLFEPASTLNTGNVMDEKTRLNLEKL